MSSTLIFTLLPRAGRWATLAAFVPLMFPAFGAYAQDLCATRPMNGDLFGEVSVVGDFNGDGHQDLVVGAPQKNSRPGVSSGLAFVYYGSSRGLGSADTLGQRGLGANEALDRFGAALSVGDYDGDGLDDLAVGAPREAPFGDPRSGYVFIFRGTAKGLVAWKGFDQRSLGDNEAGDRFGSALSSGDFDGDGRDDLAVGAPGESLSDISRTGYVFLYRGSKQGPIPWHGLDQTLLDRNDPNDAFGSALAAGDFNGDGLMDLAVGAPGETIHRAKGTGLVYIFEGRRRGLLPWQRLDQKELGSNEAGDDFGRSLAAGDINGDGKDDLVVGAPGEAPFHHPRSGYALVFEGSELDGLRPAYGVGQDRLGKHERGDLFGLRTLVHDINGDGLEDLLVGAPWSSSDGRARAGQVFLYRSEGGRLAPFKALDQSGAGLEEQGDRFGSSIAAIELAQNGLPDLIVGAPREAVGAQESGGYLFRFENLKGREFRAQPGLDQPQIQIQIPVSVKMVLDASEQLPRGRYGNHNEVRRVFREINTILAKNRAAWRVELQEVINVSGLEDFYQIDDGGHGKHRLEKAARRTAHRSAWRNDAINIYVLDEILGIGGICSFPAKDHLIVINSKGILNHSAGWLHELGHYFSLRHTFSDADSDTKPGDRRCEGSGALHQIQGKTQVTRCPDSCPHDLNVMSYNGFSPTEGRFSPCQLREMSFEICDPRGSRHHVVQIGRNGHVI